MNIFGGYKVQGRGDEAGDQLLSDALALEAAGAQLLVLECVPVELAKRITEALAIPVIGIGAGNVTDGQIRRASPSQAATRITARLLVSETSSNVSASRI